MEKSSFELIMKCCNSSFIYIHRCQGNTLLRLVAAMITLSNVKSFEDYNTACFVVGEEATN